MSNENKTSENKEGHAPLAGVVRSYFLDVCERNKLDPDFAMLKVTIDNIGVWEYDQFKDIWEEVDLLDIDGECEI